MSARGEDPGANPDESFDVSANGVNGDEVPFSNIHWRGLSDRVMGGVSRAAVTYESIDGRWCARLTGDVRLDNNGGFIQMAMNLAPEGELFDASGFHGLVMDVWGNGETYGSHLRTPDARRPWQSYRARFEAGPEWTKIRIPFSHFKPHRLSAPLDLTRLRRLGLVAIGHAFHADLAVARVALYR